MIAVRRRRSARSRPRTAPSLPQSVKVVLPPRHRVNWLRVAFALVPVGVFLAGGYLAYKKFSAPAAEEEPPPELQEVTLKVPPPEPEPEAAPEPEPEAEPESELPDLLSESDGDLGPSTDISLDLALGTGSGGMAIGTGPKAGAGAGAAKAAYDPGQVEKLSEKLNCQEPEFPRQALDKGVSGKFVAGYVVNAKGRVESGSIRITGSPAGYGFEAAIAKALTRCRFNPAMAGGVPVPESRSDEYPFDME